MLDRNKLIHMLRQMYRIRFFEERLKQISGHEAYFTGSAVAGEGQLRISGTVHLYIGQEAVAVGVCAALEREDYIASTHRGHGHFIAKGGDIKRALAELTGRETGCSQGWGGSMHMFDREHGILGGNGIVGGQMPISLGPAFAARYRGTRQVSVAFFSDGAANQGTFHESLNLAAIWRLPVIFVCENNLYALTTPTAISLPIPDIAQRAHGYGIPGVVVDGQDVLAMYEAAAEAVARARAGNGPTLIEAKTYRFEAHCGTSGAHENPPECLEWRKRDPVGLLEKRLLADGVTSVEELEKMKTDTLAELDEAVRFALSSPLPDPKRLESLCI